MEKDEQRKEYDKAYDKECEKNIAFNRLVISILTPNVESSMTFYLYLN